MIDPATKSAAIRMLIAGALTFDEVVKLACVSRFTVYRWCSEAGIDPRARRMKRAQATWESTLKGPRRKLSKTRLHDVADQAKVEWDQRHEHPEADEGLPAPWE